MSYETKPALRRNHGMARMVRAAPPSLGIWPLDQIAEFVVGSSSGEQIECKDKANVAVAPIDARIMDLSKNWNPSGYYTPAQMSEIVNQTLIAIHSAGDHLRAAPTATSDAQQMINDAASKLARRGTESLAYTRAHQSATSQGIKIVDAPGLRRWVISSLGDVSFAHTIAYVQECAKPGLAGAIIAYQKVFDGVADTIKAIVGVAIDVVKALGKLMYHLPDTLSTAYTYLKWAAIIGGGVWAFLEIKKRSGK
jgi:hypothetical protein